jgi:LPXTG-site transpeptidase (sortase) family protein
MLKVRFLAIFALMLAACSNGTMVEAATTSTSSTSSTTSTTLAPETTTTSEPGMSPYADLVVPLGSAAYDPDAIEPPGPVPVSITIDGAQVLDAPVIPVGVLENGEMEIPGRLEVGWYQYGPRPGEEGSSVLAGHIAFDNRPGVFRRLASVELGSVVSVEYEDGSISEFEVIELAQYGKLDLPFDRVFSKTGEPVLTLITCGGEFNRSLASYEDNIVAYAIPLDA